MVTFGMSSRLKSALDAFNLVLKRDGLKEALDYVRQCIKVTRKAYLDPVKYGMYKRQMLQSYIAHKKLLRYKLHQIRYGLRYE